MAERETDPNPDETRPTDEAEQIQGRVDEGEDEAMEDREEGGDADEKERA